MFEIGRLCMKLAGRDAGKKCVVVDVLDDNYVLIDGQTRRKKCNLKHLEPLNIVLKLDKNASNKVVIDALKEENIDCLEKKEKEKKAVTTRPKKQKVVKNKGPKTKKADKKSKAKYSKTAKSTTVDKPATDAKKPEVKKVEAKKPEVEKVEAKK